MSDVIFDQPFDVRAFVEVDATASCVAAVLYDVANGKEIASFETEMRDFPEALGRLKEFCRQYPVWTFDNCQKILEQNCTNFSVTFPFRHPFIRVKALLTAWGVRPSGYSAGNLHKAAGLKDDGTVGRLHDARSVAGTVSFFENLGLI